MYPVIAARLSTLSHALRPRPAVLRPHRPVERVNCFELSAGQVRRRCPVEAHRPFAKLPSFIGATLDHAVDDSQERLAVDPFLSRFCQPPIAVSTDESCSSLACTGAILLQPDHGL